MTPDAPIRQLTADDGTRVVLKKINWEPLHEIAYRELRRAIMSARYAPGETLTVRATADALGVSPMPVRAAFSRLIAERAVEALGNGTVIIPVMTRARFDDLVGMRLLLEVTAAEWAAHNVTPTQLERLEYLAKALTEAAGRNSIEYLDLNQEYKFTICDASGSPALRDLVERLWLQYGPFMHTYVQDFRALSLTDEYVDVAKALAKGDAAEARAAMERDIHGGVDFILNLGHFVED